MGSRKYEVEYVDGHVEELTANLIAENSIAQVDEEGRRQMMMSAIVDNRTLPDAITQSLGTYVIPYGVKRRKSLLRLAAGNFSSNGVMVPAIGFP
jgi:hypothetical protein